MALGKLRTLALLAIACAGLLGGHWLTYLRLAPSAGTRAALLEASGHGYLDRAMVLSGALALMAVLFWLADGALKRGPGRPSLAGTALVLAAVQVAGFTGQEVLERVLAGAPLADLSTVLLVGLPLQVMVAAAGAVLVTALHRAGHLIATTLSRSGPVAAPSPKIPLDPSVHFTCAVPSGGLRSRGPPVLLS
ncbi:MAG TPA: hypothetical protein VM754_06645 [Actinomycetota bacterium]|jgi:hypothetical protein|nr:hypothetical protein [Actinomycetota bacterium]